MGVSTQELIATCEAYGLQPAHYPHMIKARGIIETVIKKRIEKEQAHQKMLRDQANKIGRR